MVSSTFEISDLDIKDASIKPVPKNTQLHQMRRQRMGGTSASAKSFGADSVSFFSAEDEPAPSAVLHRVY